MYAAVLFYSYAYYSHAALRPVPRAVRQPQVNNVREIGEIFRKFLTSGKLPL